MQQGVPIVFLWVGGPCLSVASSKIANTTSLLGPSPAPPLEHIEAQRHEMIEFAPVFQVALLSGPPFMRHKGVVDIVDYLAFPSCDHW